MESDGINQAKAHLFAEATAEKGEENVTGIAQPKERVLGFYPIQFKSDLLKPTDEAIVNEFYK